MSESFSGFHSHGDVIAPQLLQICSVRVGKALFGIPVADILEIVGDALPQRVPLAPDYVGGLVLYRGDVLTTVSLRQLLGLAGSVTRQDLLVLESAHGSFGVLVDSVGEVLTLSSDDHEPNPAAVEAASDQHRRAFFNGVYKLPGGLLVLLAPEELDPVRLASIDEDHVNSKQPGNQAWRQKEYRCEP